MWFVDCPNGLFNFFQVGHYFLYSFVLMTPELGHLHVRFAGGYTGPWGFRPSRYWSFGYKGMLSLYRVMMGYFHFLFGVLLGFLSSWSCPNSSILQLPTDPRGVSLKYQD